MEARRVSLFLFSPAVPSTMGAAPARNKKPPPFCAAGGGFDLEAVNVELLVKFFEVYLDLLIPHFVVSIMNEGSGFVGVVLV